MFLVTVQQRKKTKEEPNWLTRFYLKMAVETMVTVIIMAAIYGLTSQLFVTKYYYRLQSFFLD